MTAAGHTCTLPAVAVLWATWACPDCELRWIALPGRDGPLWRYWWWPL